MAEASDIARRALEGRVERALAKDGLVLKKSRSGADLDQFGEYYIIDGGMNMVTHQNCDLEGLAEEYKVLEPRERLED